MFSAANNRNEKLALAKKKLKQFQNRKRSSSRSQRSEHDGDYAGQFDDTFDDRAMSEGHLDRSSENLASSNTSLTKNARRSSAVSSRFLETPEPIRISVDPTETVMLQKPVDAGHFSHDEQRSPFQRVGRTSDVGYSAGYANEYSPHDNTDLEKRGNVNGDFGDPSSPLNRENNFTSSPPMMTNNEPSNVHMTAVSAISPASTCSSDFGHHADMSSNSRIETKLLMTTESELHGVNTVAEKAQLEATVHQQKDYIDQLNAQLQQLHSHYSQLHNAYTAILQNQQSANDAHAAGGLKEECAELRKQTQIHLHTMSVLVDEKTDLQSQLRQAMEIANQKHFENEELQGRLKANRDRLSTIEQTLESRDSSYSNLENTLSRQASELERLRLESAQWQARASEAQQDRSELSAKLKVRSRELDDITTRLKNVEKQLHLKEIYVQQLTGGAGALQQQQLLADELESQRKENADLRLQLEVSRKAQEHIAAENAQVRERYETYTRQIGEQVAIVSCRLETAEREKLELQQQYEQLEKQLPTERATEATEETLSPQEVEELKNRLNEYHTMVQGSYQQIAELTKVQTEMQSTIASLSGMLAERDQQIRKLDEMLKEKYQQDDSAKGLLEQLHNEKATVSRAVAQNMELKKQLVELQEKFVEMSEKSMEAVNNMETSERKTRALQEHIDLQSTEITSLKAALQELDNNVQSKASQELERSQWEDRIRHYEAVQKTYDTELEQSRREVSHLSVENTDLRQRVSVLQDANRGLQSENQRLSDGDHESSLPSEEIENLKKTIAESEVKIQQLTKELEASMNGHEAANENVLPPPPDNELIQTRQNLQRLSIENAELHRILQQNAEDENQNTIHVELRHALNRSTTLANENDRLQQRIAELETQLTALNNERNEQNSCQHHNHQQHHHHHHEENGDEHSSVCSENNEQKLSTEAVENMRVSMEQLQQRFMRAMDQNADLSDQNQHLEHLITQLQSETETIGEYVTLYQHQRRKVQERLKEKEEYAARLSREKAEVQDKLAELQQLVVRLLRERGDLRPYVQLPPVYGGPPKAPPSVAPSRPRTLSQTVVDETVGQETEVAVAAEPEKTSNGDEVETTKSGISTSDVVNENSKQKVTVESKPTAKLDGDGDASADDATAERILRLLMEMQRPELINTLPPAERNLHCKYCTGRLVTL